MSQCSNRSVKIVIFRYNWTLKSHLATSTAHYLPIILIFSQIDRARLTSKMLDGLTLPLYSELLYQIHSQALSDCRELLFANTADRAYPILWNILKCCSGSYTSVRITYSRVVNPRTYCTYILFHSYKELKVKVPFYQLYQKVFGRYRTATSDEPMILPSIYISALYVPGIKPLPS